MLDLSRAQAIAILVVAIYVAAGGVLVHWLGRLAMRRLSPGAGTPEGAGPGRLRRAAFAFRIAVLALAGLGVLCALHARFVEPFWPTVNRVSVATPGLPAGGRPVRLVLLADTHCDVRPGVEERVPEIIAGLSPDAIVFAGDALNCEEGLPRFKKLMARLAAVAPTYAVRGNWDVWYFPGAGLFDGTGAEVLDGRAVPVRAGGAEVWLAGAGVDPRARPGREAGLRQARAALAAVPPGRPAVFVHHYPEVAALGLEAGAGLALGADTHGGQIRLPAIGALIRLSRMGGYFEPGLHDLPGGRLYVNQGLGMEGGRAPRMRFLCQPEITLIELVPESGRPAAR